MARDLEADLKLCESINVGSSSFNLGNFAAAASIGWPETIRELMEARKRIEELEEENRRCRNTMRNARRRIEELEDDE